MNFIFLRVNAYLFLASYLIVTSLQSSTNTRNESKKNGKQPRLIDSKRKTGAKFKTRLDIIKDWDHLRITKNDTTSVSTNKTESSDSNDRLLALATTTRSENVVSIGVEIAVEEINGRQERWLNRIAIFSSEKNDIIYVANVPPSKKVSQTRSFYDITPYTEIRRNLIRITKNKIVVGVNLASITSLFEIYLKYWQIRELSCLKKFHDCLTFEWLSLNFQTNSYTRYNIMEPMYYFLGIKPNENNCTYSAEEKARISMNIYKKFSDEWENELGEIFQNMDEEKLEEKIYSLPSAGHFEKIKEKVKQHTEHTGFHCDLEEYSLKNFEHYFANTYFSLYVEFSRNFASKVIVIKYNGELEVDADLPKITNSYRRSKDPSWKWAVTKIDGIFQGHGKNVLIGYNIKRHLESILGKKVKEFENRIYDIRDLIEKYENGDPNLSLKRYAEIYLHINFSREPDSLYKSKICMQLFKLFRFDRKLWPDTYQEMWGPRAQKELAKNVPESSRSSHTSQTNNDIYFI